MSRVICRDRLRPVDLAVEAYLAMVAGYQMPEFVRKAETLQIRSFDLRNTR
jgi:hypothetical protein